jgi:anaphase-promoting complex subunit 3
LGKICLASHRRERAATYFKMSLQLDPLLFTSYTALCEMGIDWAPTAVFGVHPNEPVTSAPSTTTTTALKTPLRAPEAAASAAHQHPFGLPTRPFVPMPPLLPETPGLTPIRATPPLHVLRRARDVANRHYYPPSPEQQQPSNSLNTTATPVTSVTRSLRYLRGLGQETRATPAATATTTTRPAMVHFPELDPTTSRQQQHSVAATGHARPFGLENRSSTAAAATSHRDESAVLTTSSTSTSATTTSDKEKPDHDAPGVRDILEVLCSLGQAYHHLCLYRCSEAIYTLQHAVPSHQRTTGWYLHQLGRAHLEINDFEAARRSLEAMRKHDPGRIAGCELLSTVYWQLKKEVDLARLAQNAVAWFRLSPQAWCVVGNCFSLQKDHETALVFFGRSLQVDPQFTYTHTLSGYEYMAIEDFDKAIACFRNAIRTDERHYQAWYGLGAIYHRQERFDLAEYHFSRAATLHPASSVLLCNLGIAQYANGKAYQALETLNQAFVVDPRNPQARFQCATIYSALHRPLDALRELRLVCNAAPREATVHFAMGKVLKRLGRAEEAVRLNVFCPCLRTSKGHSPFSHGVIPHRCAVFSRPWTWIPRTISSSRRPWTSWTNQMWTRMYRGFRYSDSNSIRIIARPHTPCSIDLSSVEPTRG